MAAAQRRLWLAVAAACALQLAASAHMTLSVEDVDTCKSALGMMRGCSPAMQDHDLQQHCCIPFYALEGLDCFCDGDLVGMVLDAMLPGTIDGLAACGVDSPFSRITYRQDVCAEQSAGEEVVLVPTDEFEFPTQLQQPGSDLLSEGAIRLGADGGILLPSTNLEDKFYFEPALAQAAEAQAAREDQDFQRAWDLFIAGDDLVLDTPQQGVSIDVAMDGGRDVFSISGAAADLSLFDGVLSITESDSDTTDVTVSSGDAQVTVSIPSDMEVEVLLDMPVAEEQEQAVLVTEADGSNAAVYNADFADVRGMMGLIGEWLGGLLHTSNTAAEGDASEQESEEVIRGLSRLLAEILAKLESSVGGTPLEVEISYELDDQALQNGETEIDIEIDPQLAPALTPQFLDERLQALSNSLNRPVRPSPVRLSDADLLEAGYGIPPAVAPPSLGNCFNTGVCAWLCRHQSALQIALGIETVLLVALLALSRWLNRKMENEALECDEESLRVPLIVYAADYAGEQQGKGAALWALTTKVDFEKA